jgi:hypothetical protein
MADFGHSKEMTFRLAQTGIADEPFRPAHPQFRTVTKPLSRQVSHFHAAGEENWKWNAIKSFLFLPLIG